MALHTYVDTFNVSTAITGTTIVRTGYGFAPKALLLWCSGRTETTDAVGSQNAKWSMGLATSPTARFTVATQVADLAATTDANDEPFVSGCLATLAAGGSGATDGILDLQSFDSDGVTFIIADAFGINVRVTVWAFGGDTLTNAAGGTFTSPIVTGNQDTVVPGSFQPDIVFFVTEGESTSARARCSFGYARSATQQGLVAFRSQDNAATSSTRRYATGAQCIGTIAASTSSLTLGATLVEMLPTGWRLNWTTVDSAARLVGYLALQGGQWLGVNSTTRTDSTAWSVTGLGGPPTGVLVASCGTVAQSLDTPIASALISVGAASTPTNRSAQGMSDESALADTEVATVLEHDAIYARLNFADALAGVMDVQSFDSDGATFVMEAADPDAAFFWAVLCGSPPGAVRSLTAILLPATTTPASAFLQERSLTTGLLSTTTTPASVASQTRALVATLSPATLTPASAVVQTRAVRGDLLTTTSTPASPVLLENRRSLTALLDTATSTPDSPVTQASALLASLLGTTTTPGSPHRLTIAHDAVSESHTATGSTGGTSFTWDHVLTTAPQGVLVFTFTNANADDATGVTYGGVALTAVPNGRAVDTAGEAGDCKAWFLGSGIPATTPAAVVVSRNNTANVMYAVCVTVTALRDTEIKGTPVLVQGDGTLDEQSLDAGTGVLALRYAGVNSGLAAVIDNPTTPGTSVSRGANSTALADIDFGQRVIEVVRETTEGIGSRPIGFRATTSEDRAAVHVAIGHVVVVETRALAAAFLAATHTPDSPITMANQRPLTAALLSTTTTPGSSATHTRAVLATLSLATLTPDSAVLSVRAVRGDLLTGTSTPPASVTLAGLLQLQASLLNSTSTPTSVATQGRTLGATLDAATSTTESPIALATLRQLVATCTTATATPPSPMTLARSLTAQALGSTTTPSATLPTVQRGLTATVSGATTTPPITALVTGQVVLVTHLLGQTSTSAPTLQVGRALTAAFQSATSTPATAPSLRRNLTAQTTATTATPASLPTVSRALIATPANTTNTPTAVRTVQCALIALVPADSVTPPISVAMAGIRQLSAGLVSLTTTPDGAAAVRRPLTTALLSTTSTPSIVQVQQQALTALVGVSTSTPAALPATTVRALLATLPGVSATPPATARSRRELTATLLHDTVTPDIALGPLVRALTAAPLLSTLTPPVLAVETVRQLTAAVLSLTLSPNAPIIVQGQVLLFANLHTDTTTPDASARQTRAMVAVLACLSSTLLADLEPGSWGEVLRPLEPPFGGMMTPTISAPHGTVLVSLRAPSGTGQGAVCPIVRPPKAA